MQTVGVLLAGACFGAGLDIITAADIRYCSADAYFCVKEVDLAIAADMGVLQRLPGLIGQGKPIVTPYLIPQPLFLHCEGVSLQGFVVCTSQLATRPRLPVR